MKSPLGMAWWIWSLLTMDSSQRSAFRLCSIDYWEASMSRNALHRATLRSKGGSLRVCVLRRSRIRDWSACREPLSRWIIFILLFNIPSFSNTLENRPWVRDSWFVEESPFIFPRDREKVVRQSNQFHYVQIERAFRVVDPYPYRITHWEASSVPRIILCSRSICERIL